jgi:hypothetical protein
MLKIGQYSAHCAGKHCFSGTGRSMQKNIVVSGSRYFKARVWQLAARIFPKNQLHRLSSAFSFILPLPPVLIGWVGAA